MITSLMLWTCFYSKASAIVYQQDDLLGGRVNDEIESMGGSSMASSGGGQLLFSGIESIRLNPAMLGEVDFYKIYTGYYWSSYGRDFYHLGVVDGNSLIKAGLSYTSFIDLSFDHPFKKITTSSDKNQQIYQASKWSYKKKQDHFYGSSLTRRVSLAFSVPIQNILLGLSGSYVDGWVRPYRQFEYSKTFGVVLGVGLVINPHPNFKLAASIDNLNNKDIIDLAPSTYRLAASYQPLKKMVYLHIDYQFRQRIRSEFLIITPPKKDLSKHQSFKSIFSIKETINSHEQSIIGSFKLVIKDRWNVIGGYLHELHNYGLNRKSASLGLLMTEKAYEIGYSIRSPYLTSKFTQCLTFTLILEPSDTKPATSFN